MSRVVVYNSMTLDGVMQAPGGPEEDTSGDFKFGGWTVPFWDDFSGNEMGEQMGVPFDLLLGRKTYEIFAGYWPYHTDIPGAAGLNSSKKYVASQTLNKVDWNNSTLLKGDVVQAIKKLKEQAGPDLLVYGSSNLIQTLLKNNLMDEYRLFIFPVLIGNGKRLFGDGTIPVGVKLIDTKTSNTGVILVIYIPGGELKTGSM